MSTTDKVTVYDESCPCGGGRITIIECTPDHPYARPNQIWYQSSFACKYCSHIYKLVEIEHREKSDFKLTLIDPTKNEIELY